MPRLTAAACGTSGFHSSGEGNLLRHAVLPLLSMRGLRAALVLGLAIVLARCGSSESEAPQTQTDAGPDSAAGAAAGQSTGAGGLGGVIGIGGLPEGAPEPSACKCTGSGYSVEVNDGSGTLKLSHAFESPEIAGYLQYCTPKVPAIFTAHAVSLVMNVSACSNADGGRPCLQLNTAAAPSYFDEGNGEVWKLSSVQIIAPGLDPPAVGSTVPGTFSATASLGGMSKPVSGTFSVCHAYAVGKPI